jgi:hypothetical protein
MTDSELLSAAIRASGLSVRRFGRVHFPLSNERTIWRWLSGHSPMSKPVRAYCEAFLATIAPENAGKGKDTTAPP